MLKNSLPENAKDARVNLSRVLTTEGAPELTERQIHGVAIASVLHQVDQAMAMAVEVA